MRRLETFTLVLAFLLALSACGGAESASPSDSGASGPASAGEGSALQNAGGFEVALPAEYVDLLQVDIEPSGGRMDRKGWTPLISVCEKASVEAAEADYGHGTGFGFLFGLAFLDQAAFEQFISADAPGVNIFATDGDGYFAYTYPTDVQFYRSGADSIPDHPDWETWMELNEIGLQVCEDFLTRNGLQSFSMADFTDQLAAGDENHVCVRYYPYFTKDGDTRIYYQLLLRQPAQQGEGGIWAVDQWLDEFGNQYLYFPDSGMPAAEYYAQCQQECGKHPELLTPAGAAAAFAQDCFDHETGGDSFEQVPEMDQGYMECNEALQKMALDLMFEKDVDGMSLLDCVGKATADNWGVLGRYMYGSDWFGPLMNAVADAAVGNRQQARDKAVMSFLLATRDAQTDFRTPLENVLSAQREADPDAFQAALAEFPKAVQPILTNPSGFLPESTGGTTD